MLRIAFAALFVLLVWNPMAQASAEEFPKIAKLKAGADFYLPLSEYASTFVDKTNGLSIEELIQQPTRFETLNTPYVDFGGILRGRAWVKVSLTNTLNYSHLWRFDINRQYYYEADVYIVRNAGSDIEHALHSRLSQSFHERVVNDRMLGVDFRMDAKESVDIYVSIKANASTFMPLGVGHVEAILDLHSQENSLNLFFNGALLTFALCALFLISVIGAPLALTFSLYMLAGFIYIFHSDGYTFVYLWPNHMHINDVMNLSFMAAMPVFGLLFSRELFQFKKYAPKFDKIILVYVMITACASLFAGVIYEIKVLKVIGYLCPPFGSILQFCAGIIAIRKGLLGARPYFVGALFIMSSFVYALLANIVSGHFNHDTTLDYGHFALVVEGIAFISAIALRLVGLRNERDLAIQKELSLTQDKLRISRQLQKSQDDFINAKKMAEMRRSQLSSVSHDLQQPLTSLRAALSRVGGTDEDAIQQMQGAFDYLEKLAFEQLEKNKPTDSNTFQTHESFALSAVLDNVYEMFRDEANKAGIKLRYRPSSLQINTDPVGLMRAVSNLVSNAIKHSNGKHILLAARTRQDTVRVEIWDTGQGIPEDQIEKLMSPYEKGDVSEGTGLGLSIVKKISDELQLNFSMHSKSGRGSVAFLCISIKE
jgi:signal transduction histidine kinase